MFLNSAGNQLHIHGHDSKESELLYQYSLLLQSENNTAHISLAILYNTMDKKEHTTK